MKKRKNQKNRFLDSSNKNWLKEISNDLFNNYKQFILVQQWNDEVMYKKIGELKLKNKDLKIMLAVGGWNHGSLLFSNMASNERNRKNLTGSGLLI